MPDLCEPQSSIARQNTSAPSQRPYVKDLNNDLAGFVTRGQIHARSDRPVHVPFRVVKDLTNRPFFIVCVEEREELGSARVVAHAQVAVFVVEIFDCVFPLLLCPAGFSVEVSQRVICRPLSQNDPVEHGIPHGARERLGVR